MTGEQSERAIDRRRAFVSGFTAPERIDTGIAVMLFVVSTPFYYTLLFFAWTYAHVPFFLEPTLWENATWFVDIWLTEAWPSIVSLGINLATATLIGIGLLTATLPFWGRGLIRVITR